MNRFSIGKNEFLLVVHSFQWAVSTAVLDSGNKAE